MITNGKMKLISKNNSINRRKNEATKDIETYLKGLNIVINEEMTQEQQKESY